LKVIIMEKRMRTKLILERPVEIDDLPSELFEAAGPRTGAVTVIRRLLYELSL
jgi:hypothetical protein